MADKGKHFKTTQDRGDTRLPHLQPLSFEEKKELKMRITLAISQRLPC